MPSIKDYAELMAARAADDAATDARDQGERVVSRPVLWVGAHGGSGARSIAAASGVGTAAWPEAGTGPSEVEAAADATAQTPAAPLVVLVARTDARGLDAAAAAIRTAPATITLLGLVLSADAPGRIPSQLRTRIHELSGAVPLLVTLPWIKSWRTHPGTPEPAVARAITRLGLSPNDNPNENAGPVR